MILILSESLTTEKYINDYFSSTSETCQVSRRILPWNQRKVRTCPSLFWTILISCTWNTI